MEMHGIAKTRIMRGPFRVSAELEDNRVDAREMRSSYNKVDLERALFTWGSP